MVFKTGAALSHPVGFHRFAIEPFKVQALVNRATAGTSEFSPGPADWDQCTTRRIFREAEHFVYFLLMSPMGGRQ